MSVTVDGLDDPAVAAMVERWLDADPEQRRLAGKVFRHAADLIGRGWCQGRFGEREDGTVVSLAAIRDPALTVDRLCIQGAVYRAGAETGLADSALVGGLAYLVPGAGWNDAAGRTAEEVATALRGAADRVEGETTHQGGF